MLAYLLTAALLLPGTARHAIAPGETHAYSVHLEAGTWLEVVLAGGEESLDARWSGPAGLVDRWQTGNIHDVEPLSVLAGGGGEYTLELTLAPEAKAGEYELRVAPPRPATAADHDRIAAQHARHEGGRLVFSHDKAQMSAGVALLERARAAWHRAGELRWEARTTLDLAQGRLWLDLPEAARELHAQALASLRTANEPYLYLRALLFAAEGHAAARQPQKAIAAYQEALLLIHALHDRRYEVIALTNLAMTCVVAGQPEDAIRYAEEALPLLRTLELRDGEAAALKVIAQAHRLRGNFAAAIEAARACLEIIRREPASGWRLPAMFTFLGDIYLSLGDPRGALYYLQTAEPPFNHNSRLSDRANRLEKLALAYEQLGDQEAALESHTQAMELRRRLDDRWSQARCLLNGARLHVANRRWPAAIAACTEALPILRESGDRWELARGLELMGSARLGSGDLEGARTALAEALDHRRAVGDPTGEAELLRLLARVARRRGAAAEAGALLAQAVQRLEAERPYVVTPDLGASWMATVRQVYEDRIAILMELDRQDAGAGFAALAFEASEGSRARSLLDLVAQRRPEWEASPELLKQKRSVEDRLASALDRQVREPHTEAEQATLSADIQALKIEHDGVEAHIQAARPQPPAATPLGLRAVQGELLGRGDLLLEYALGGEESFLWVVSDTGLRSYRLPARDTITLAVKRAHRALARRPTARTATETRSALAHLAALVVGPAAAQLGRRRLLIVADGALHHVPFAALPDARGVPLVESHEIAMLPSASVAARARADARRRPPPPKTLAVFADPVFRREDERLKAAPAGATATASDPRLESATRDLEDGRLFRLPFTRLEARRILALVPPGSRRAALDFAAARATALDPDLANYRFLHFATHGVLNGTRPELSGVVLSLLDADGRDVRGFLAAPDVLGLKLNADLVVLSGCATALGREVDGEGLLGLTRAFLSSGARRVLASLWRVDDLATAELMAGFYGAMLGPRHLRPSAAYRAAQRALIRSPRWSAPYYWAGFQLQGE